MKKIIYLLLLLPLGVMAQQITELKDVDVNSKTYSKEFDFEPNAKVEFRLTYTSEIPLLLSLNGNTYSLEKSKKEKIKFIAFYTNESGKVYVSFQGYGDHTARFEIKKIELKEATEHLGHR